MFKSKKFIALALVTAAALLLAGCAPAKPAPEPAMTDAPAAEAAPQTITEKAAEVVEAAETKVEEAADKMAEAGKEAVEDVKETVAEAGEAAVKAADDLTQKAGEAVETAKEALSGEMEPVMLTLEELKEFNGKNGKPAYIAVDGVIYDVTESPLWKGGMHNGFEAGQDLTEALKGAPHGAEKLENVVEIGKVKE